MNRADFRDLLWAWSPVGIGPRNEGSEHGYDEFEYDEFVDGLFAWFKSGRDPEGHIVTGWVARQASHWGRELPSDEVEALRLWLVAARAGADSADADQQQLFRRFARDPQLQGSFDLPPVGPTNAPTLPPDRHEFTPHRSRGIAWGWLVAAVCVLIVAASIVLSRSGACLDYADAAGGGGSCETSPSVPQVLLIAVGATLFIVYAVRRALKRR